MRISDWSSDVCSSDLLMRATGWRVVAVPGLVPDEVFFDHLANRRFVSGNFIRSPDQLDYLEEPDVFHDVFGHVPLLADPVFAEIGRAHVLTPVTNAHLVCRLLLENQKQYRHHHI